MWEKTDQSCYNISCCFFLAPMNTNSIAFKINSPKVVQEIIDGEAVIVNLETGFYYSLLETGAEIWSKIEQGIPEELIVKYMLNNYQGDSETITQSVKYLITQLQEEELIKLTEKIDHVSEEENSSKNGEKLPFKVPVMNKYTDMEDILALDPIHDVDEMGWPNAKSEEKIIN